MQPRVVFFGFEGVAMNEGRHARREAAKHPVALKGTGVPAGGFSGALPAKDGVRFLAPCFVALFAIVFALLLVYPIMKLSPHGIPIAVCSLDEGVVVSDATVNAGDSFLEMLTDSDEEDASDGEGGAAAAEADADADDAEAVEEGSSGGLFSVSSDSVAWTVFDSPEEMEAALRAGDYYAAIAIPQDFSERLIAVRGRELLGSQLLGKLPELSEGTDALALGLSKTASGTDQLEAGLGALAQGSKTLGDAVAALPEGVSSLQEGSASLAAALGQAQGGTVRLVSGLGQAGDAAAGVEDLANKAIAALESGDYEAAADYLEQLAAANSGAQSLLSALGSNAAGLSAGLSAAAEGAGALNDGVGRLGEGADSLAEGVASLSQGAGSAYSGSSALSDASQTLSSGAAALSGGLSTAADALEALPERADGEGFAVDDGGSSFELSLDSAEDPNAPYVSLLINPGKNPMVTNSLSSAFSSFESYGVVVKSTMTSEIPEALSAGYAHMPLLIMTYLASYAAAAVTGFLLGSGRGGRSRAAARLGVQALVSVAAALVVGLAVAALFNAALGASVDYLQLALFLALCSLALQLVVVGSLDLFGKPGMAVPLLLMALCMLCAYLPYEFLPEFWQNCIYPWNPLRFMVDGFKEILYVGSGAVNGATPAVLAMAAVGAAAMLLSLLKPSREGAEE